jgi:hypothetical protein
MQKVLEEDFSRIPELIGQVLEPQPEPTSAFVAEPAVQLGLF